VIDQGPGMDEETRRSVFEKFFQAQTAQKEQGFGLGLAICKLIVESHGGQIGVDSTPGVGTTFWFEVPVASK
jgi:signal transduction histidine kinase